MVLIYGRKTTTQQKTHYVVVRKTKDSIRRSGTDGKNDETYRESQLAINWSHASVRYHSREKYYMQSVFPQELISDYSYSRGGGAELLSNYSYSLGRGTERP